MIRADCSGRVGSENGGCSIMETNAPTGRPFWLGDTEREIFSAKLIGLIMGIL